MGPHLDYTYTALDVRHLPDTHLQDPDGEINKVKVSLRSY